MHLGKYGPFADIVGIAGALVATGLVIAGLSLTHLKAGHPQMAQTGADQAVVFNLSPSASSADDLLALFPVNSV